MALWQIALIAFAIAWAFQAVGVWRQTQHYHETFADLRSRWHDGEMGAGAAPARFGKGVIALIVVSPSGDIRAARAMVGRTVFAKFSELRDLEGLSLEEFGARIVSSDFDGAKRLALSKALEQIARVREERRGGKRAETVTALAKLTHDNGATMIKGEARC